MALTRDNGYPRKDIDKSGTVWVDRYHGPYQEIMDIEIVMGAPCEFAKGLTLNKASISRDESGTIGYIDYTYAAEDTTITMDTNQIEFSVSSSAMDRPIELHPAFVCKWCYYLYVHPDHKNDQYSNWNADTDPAAIPNSNYPYHMWLRDKSLAPVENNGKRWEKQKDPVLLDNNQRPIGQHVTTYIVPLICVEESKYWSSDKKVGTILTATGSLGAPTKTFGLSSTSTKWLNLGTNVRRDGRKWVSTTNRQYDPDGYLTEIYSVPS